MSCGVAAWAQVSTTLGAVIPAQRAEQAWTEGVAIWVAVIVVSFVGAPMHPCALYSRAPPMRHVSLTRIARAAGCTGMHHAT